MKNKLRLVFIIMVLWFYTALKVIQTWSVHAILAQILTLILFTVMISWLFMYHSNSSLVERRWFQIWVWLGTLTMGFWTTFMMLSIPIDLAFLLYYGLHFVSKALPYDSSTMAVLSTKINVALLIFTVCAVVVGLIMALREPRVKKIFIPLAKLPKELHGLKIAQISDLHVGPTIRKHYVDKVVRQTNDLDADIIVITGDLADADAESIEVHLQPLAALKSRFGVYYVTGNHEYYWGVEGWITRVARLGFISLINENKVIDINGVNVLIAGITDHIGGSFLKSHAPDLKKASLSEESIHLKILLAHRPDVYIAAEKMGYDLQLSGHTHAGQFFPFNVLIPLVYKYYRRLNKYGELWLYVNPGTGYWGPANRFGIPAEISLLELVIER